MTKLPWHELKKHLIFLFLFSIVLSAYTAHFSHYNNYLIFKASFFHLLDGTSLYIHYPEEHNDLFKYSPSFSLFMLPFAYFPDVIGATLWNLLGVGLFVFALLKLPVTISTRKGIFWVSLPEFIGSIQNYQSNIHMIALLMLFWIFLEKGNPWLAALSLLATVFIKIFGVLGFGLLFFSKYSTKNLAFFKRFIFATVILTLTLTLLPAIFTGFDGLLYQYQEWLRLLRADASTSYGFSYMGLIQGFTGLDYNRLWVQLPGGILMVTALLWSRNAGPEGRLYGFISLCYFFVVFNHKSESPTFIIPMIAFGLHQAFITPKKLRWSVIWGTLFFVSIVYSDLFSRNFKNTVADLYAVKAWPFMILWPWTLWSMYKAKKLTD